MIIGINLLYLIPNQVGGTEYYARSILSALDAHDPNNNYILFCNQENCHSFKNLSKKFKIVCLPIHASNRIARILYEQLIFPFEILKYSCDVCYSPGYIGPALVPGVRKVVTVHDTNWKDHPEDFSFISYWATKLVTEFSMLFATQLIVSSDFAKQRLLHFFPFYAKKTQVVWPGIEESFKKAVATAPKPKIKKYLLTVSAFYPHKKITYVLDLFEELKKHPDFKDYSLVLIGNNGNDKQKVLDKIAILTDVHYFPKVSYSDLISYYKHAALVIQPSIYEGFGYPVYEAITAGKRVLVGNKKLYHLTVQKNLSEITHSVSNDIKIIKNTYKNSNTANDTAITFFKYKRVVADLLETFYGT